MIKYTSPTIGGGVTVEAGYAPGEGQETAATGGKDNDKFQEFSARWSSGPLSLGAAAGTSTSQAVASPSVDAKSTVVGGSYSFGAAKVYVLYSQTKVDGGAEAKATSVTGKYTIGMGDIVLAIGNKKVSPGTEVDSSLMGLGYYHHLSKTTNLFVTYGSVSNDANTALAAPRQAVPTTANGEDPTVIAVGWVQHF
jgi:predicted porin